MTHNQTSNTFSNDQYNSHFHLTRAQPKFNLIAQTLDHFWFQNTVLTCVWALISCSVCIYVQEVIMAKCSHMIPHDIHICIPTFTAVNYTGMLLHYHTQETHHQTISIAWIEKCQSNGPSLYCTTACLCSARNKDQLKIGYFIGYSLCPIENVQVIWLTKMDFGQPNAEVGRKMANGWLLFLALLMHTACMLVQSYLSHRSSFWNASCVR